MTRTRYARPPTASRPASPRLRSLHTQHTLQRIDVEVAQIQVGHQLLTASTAAAVAVAATARTWHAMLLLTASRLLLPKHLTRWPTRMASMTLLLLLLLSVLLLLSLHLLLLLP